MKENEITYDDLLAENKELKKRVFEAEKEINNSKLLNKSEQFLKSIFDHSPTAMIICEAPDGKITYINDAVWGFRGETDARMTNISVEEYVMTWKEFYPDGRQYSGEEMPLARSLINGEIVENEQLIVRLEDGTEKWAAAWSAPIYDNSKNIIAAIVLFYDITEHKLMENTLAVSSSAAGIWDWDIVINKLDTSARFKNLIGYESDEIDISLDVFFNLLHPEDLDKVQLTLNRHLKERLDYDVDYRLQTKSGEYRWFHARGQALWDKTGAATRMSGSILDITDRKKTEADLRISEERYELAIEGSEAGIWDYNIESGEIYYSDQFNEMLGYKPQEIQDTVETAFNRIHPDHRDQAKFALSQHLEMKSPYYATEYLGQTKSGEYRWFQARGKAVWDENGNATRVAGSFIDIHEQKQAEAELEKSSKLARDLIEQSPLPVEILSPEGKIIQVNSAWKKLWKVSDEEAAETLEKYNMLSDPQLEKLGVMDEVRQAFKGKHIILPPVKYDTSQTKDDFDIKQLKSFRSPWTQCHLSAVINTKGEIAYIVNTYVDITDLKETEEILSKSETRYRQMLDNSPLPVAIFTREGVLSKVNSSWKKLWGLNDEETAQVMANYNMLSDKQIKELGYMPLVERAYKGESIILPIIEYEGKRTLKDLKLDKIESQSRWIQTHLFSVKDDKGDIDSIVSKSMDLTELKEAEEILVKSENRYRHLVEHSPLSIAIFTEDGKLNQVNTAWKKLWRLSEEETLQVMENYNIFTDKQMEESGHAPLVVSAFKGEDIVIPPMEYKGNVTTKEIALEAIKAQSRWIQSHLYSVQHPNGDLDYVVNINMDLTALKKAEKETQQQRNVLARIDRASSMGQLTGSIAHELNQPLTGILSNAQAAEIMLKNKHWDETEFKEILTEIVSDTKRASAVIRNLRSLYQKKEVDFSPIDINTLLNEVINLLHSEFVIKNIDVTLKNTSLFHVISGNKVQIEQVLVNLILNGIESMDTKERQDRKLLIRCSSKGNEVKMFIEDKGLGIDSEIIDSIFEPLATWKPNGTGMGLAISNTIIQAHGGRMFAKNRTHGGARVGFILPVIKEKE